jgi:hypothetical protein
MANQPIINGRVVERAYEDYRNNVYLVNRRYQRKLVWDINEKRAFINSLSKGYPVPLFLFSTSEFKGAQRREIIDGMQRLNAIFSFIENEYSLEDRCYFDLSATAITKSLLDNGNLTQKTPILARDICVNIVSYELPFSVYNESDPDVIDEVFRRINANGQHLSRQEIRQAGATGEFAQLVRQLSTQIRGDASHGDILLLSKMKEISINRESHNMGINPDNVFWIKENIINKEDLRQSMDEEIISDLLASSQLSPIPPSNVTVLDEYYGFKSVDSEKRFQRIEDAIGNVSSEKLSAQFPYVIDEIKNIFFNRPKTIIGQIVGPRVYKGPRYFQVLFMSLYDLLIRQEKKIIDYDGIYNILDGISSRTMKVSAGGGWWSSKEKIELVAAISAVLAPCFIDRSGGDPMYNSYATEIETLLTQSRTENGQYDFKQGVYNLTTNDRNDTLIKKIFKTLSAMANADKNAVGYVLIGVADKHQDAKKIRDKYGTDSTKVGKFYITGIDGEVNKYFGGNYDAYYAMIKDAIREIPMSEHYKRQLGSKMRMANYHNQSVIILRLVSDNGAVMFDNAYYTRNGASNDPEPVSAEAMPAFFAKFAK